MLIFATVAALIPYATPGFIAFGVGAIAAGWIADKWSREGMMVIFFIGIGASSIVTALADSPLEMALGLLAIGVFAAIYHPVGVAMVVQGRRNTGVPLADQRRVRQPGCRRGGAAHGLSHRHGSWRNAFVLPGAATIGLGVAYAVFVWTGRGSRAASRTSGAAVEQARAGASSIERGTFVRVLAIIVFTTAIGGLIFQSTTFSLPKIFDERLGELAGSATAVGGYASLVFAIAALAQLVVGYLVDRHSVRTVFAFVAGLQAVFFAVMYRLTGVAALVVAVAFMLVVFGQIPINDVLIGRITKGEWRSRVYFLRYIVTFSVMASTLPVIAGIHAGWGFGALFVVMAIAASGTFAAVLMLPRTAATG